MSFAQPASLMIQSRIEKTLKKKKKKIIRFSIEKKTEKPFENQTSRNRNTKRRRFQRVYIVRRAETENYSGSRAWCTAASAAGPAGRARDMITPGYVVLFLFIQYRCCYYCYYRPFSARIEFRTRPESGGRRSLVTPAGQVNAGPRAWNILERARR